jgi:hypothetical protein
MTAETDTSRLETPTAQMGQILFSHFLVQGLHVAAELGIADLLATQPKTSVPRSGRSRNTDAWPKHDAEGLERGVR